MAIASSHSTDPNVSIDPSEVREFLEDEFDRRLADASFTDQLPGHLPGDEAIQGRVPLIIKRLRQLAGI